VTSVMSLYHHIREQRYYVNITLFAWHRYY